MEKVRRILVDIDTRRSYQRDMIEGIIQFNHKVASWELMTPNAEYTTSQDILVQEDIDGILVEGLADLLYQVNRDKKIPGVVLAAWRSSEDFPSVSTDLPAVTRIIFDYFRQRGYRRFAFYGNPGHGRSEFLAQLTRAEGLAFAELDGPEAQGPSISKEQRDAWLGSLSYPAAVVAAGIPAAREVLTSCRIQNILVPEQVAVMAIGNDELRCELANPPLSGAGINAVRIGYHGARLLHEWLENDGPQTMQHTVGPGEIIERRSSQAMDIDDPALQKALAFIYENTGEPFEVQDVTDAVSIGARTLQRRFKQTLGRTVQQEILRTRVEQAKRLLASTDLDMHAVALRSGFGHRQRMNPVFKRLTGMSPSQYRLRHLR
jgi:LacI family transcriptional regulator